MVAPEVFRIRGVPSLCNLPSEAALGSQGNGNREALSEGAKLQMAVKRGATTGMNEWLPIAYRAHWALVWSAGSDPVPAP